MNDDGGYLVIAEGPPHSRGSPTDGIQTDRSFHQHGPELLAGSYGKDRALLSITIWGHRRNIAAHIHVHMLIQCTPTC